MRKSFAVLANLLMLAIVAQFFLAASGAFDTAPAEEAFRTHRALGGGLLLLAVIVTIVAAVARMPGRVIGLAGLVAGLTLVQFVIRSVASALDGSGGSTAAGEFVFGLHALNGLAILAVTAMIIRRAGRLSRPAAGELAGAGANPRQAP